MEKVAKKEPVTVVSFRVEPELKKRLVALSKTSAKVSVLIRDLIKDNINSWERKFIKK